MSKVEKILLVVLFVIALVIAVSASSTLDKYKVDGYDTKIVQPGDRLWNMVDWSKVPAELPKQDYIDLVVAINKVDPGKIQPGQVIDLPRVVKK